MAQPTLSFQKVSYTYPGSSSPVISDLTLQLTRGWTGIVGANGAGKTTLLQLANGLLAPNQGSLHAPSFNTYCDQRTDLQPAALEELLSAPDGYRTVDALKCEWDWPQRWDTLSHGERKRAWLAVALWQKPTLLAVDEPTNHLDEEGKALIKAALKKFSGIGLLVSHDKQLLDELCSNILFLDAGHGTLRPGNFSSGKTETERERQEGLKRYDKARKERSRLDREIKKARDETARGATRLSKRGIGIKDHDARGKIDAARLSGKDTVSTRKASRLETRRDREEDTERKFKPNGKMSLGIEFMTRPATKRRLCFSEEISLSLGNGRQLCLPTLLINSGDRIGIKGANGTGKTTLLRHLLQCSHLSEHLLYLPQELSIAETTLLKQQVDALSGSKKGKLMQLVSRLGSDPKRLLDSALPSPGEARKLLISLGLLQEPDLLIMDEPTNHLDLPSVECLEQALMEVPTGLVLVSHDETFRNNLTQRQWHLENNEGGHVVLS